MARPSRVARGAATLFVGTALLVAASAGCGEGAGVAEDALVTVYVEAPLCLGAQRELRSQGGEAGDLRVSALCLPSPRERGKLDLATLGANARRATEDSTAVAYLEGPDPQAARFTRPILETAEIPWISEGSGAAAMSRLLELIEATGSGSLRESLREDLN